MQWIPRLFFNQSTQKNKFLQNFKDFYSALNKRFPVIFTLGHFAHKTGIPFSYLNSIVSRSTLHEQYKFFTIKKHNGGHRKIYAPNSKLKIVQKWILRFILSNCEESNYSYAYQRNKNILSCVKNHTKSKWLIKIDISHFFESISEIQVYHIFREIGYTPLLSFQLSRICTIVSGRIGKDDSKLKKKSYWGNNHSNYKIKQYYSNEIGHLPQGAPTSPKLANLAVKKMDEEIVKILSNYDICYTRYADDIPISSASTKLTSSLKNIIISSVYSVIKTYGLRPNMQKLKVIYPGSRKIVLGLNVESDHIHLSKKFKNNLECHLYYIKKDVKHHIEKRDFDSYLGLKHHVNGLINYAKNVEPQYIEKLRKKNLLPKWDFE